MSTQRKHPFAPDVTAPLHEGQSHQEGIHVADPVFEAVQAAGRLLHTSSEQANQSVADAERSTASILQQMASGFLSGSLGGAAQAGAQSEKSGPAAQPYTASAVPNISEAERAIVDALAGMCKQCA